MFPVATLEARQHAEALAEAFAADLNSKAGREIAAAKVILQTADLNAPHDYVFTLNDMSHDMMELFKHAALSDL